jgi:hypothetical protein
MHHGVSVRLRLHGAVRGCDPAIDPKREKAVPARCAAVGGKAQQPKRPGEHAHPMLARNALQVHVSAHFAMHVPDITHGSGPGVKARIASPATPWAQPCQPHQVVLYTASAGTSEAVAMAGRTQQFGSPLGSLLKRLREGSLRRQVPTALKLDRHVQKDKRCRIGALSRMNTNHKIQFGTQTIENAPVGLSQSGHLPRKRGQSPAPGCLGRDSSGLAPGARPIQVWWGLDHHGGSAAALGHPPPQIVDNDPRLGDNRS